MLNNEQPAPGRHLITWDGKNDDGLSVPNNAYIYQLTAGEFTDQKVLILNVTDPDEIRNRNSIPLAKSNSQGELELGYEVLPIGKSTVLTDAQGNIIGTLKIRNLIFLKDGYEAFTKPVSIDTSQTLSISIMLQKQ